jgi:glycerol-1-phosphate dehydrogenase [NAD(P)+]
MQRIWNLPITHLLHLNEWQETRPVALVYSRLAWKAIRGQLRLPVAWQGEPLRAETQVWDELFAGAQGEVVYAVGGGLAVDAAKYLAAVRSLPLVCVPTALSVDAFFTWASGVRREGGVTYIETKAPETAVVDLSVIAAAPQQVRAAGICDVLSIATGMWDWEFAHQRGKNPSGMEYIPYAAQAARAILQGALDCAEAAGKGDFAGLKQLMDCLALEVQLCNQLGHSRPEEGSEHYFAYAVEQEMGPGLPHGDLVGPGILWAAERQGQPTRDLRRALQACAVPLENIPPEVMKRTALNLPEYVRRHNLPFGIAHVLNEPAQPA